MKESNKIEMRKIIRKAKGVTMLALVVTIIVLLILAAITLSLAVGENGIIKRAKLARDKVKNASIAEEEAMNTAAEEIDNAEGGSSSGGTCPDVSELEDTIKELQNTIASLEQQLANEKANKAELERQIASLNNQIANLNNELNSKKEEIADLQGQLASKNEEIARKDETIRNLQETVDRLNTQIEELNRQIETLKTKQATGNATVSEVLAGKTFSNSSGVGLVGTMANNGAISKTLNAGESYTVPAGYHNGSGKVMANSLASQTAGTAGTEDILTGKTAWVNGQKIIGERALGGNLEILEYKVLRERTIQKSYDVDFDTSALTGKLVVQIFGVWNFGVAGCEVYTPEGFEVKSFDAANHDIGYNYLRICTIEDISSIDSINFGVRASTAHTVLLQYAIYNIPN